ncbi:hypothetical protein M0R45_003755 [Rubus argutus]|uniref:Uncharacterized protein n=1 Tax=Rubus argutus TaxID=59490 RepID=A0AAW1YIG2_RUBAR
MGILKSVKALGKIIPTTKVGKLMWNKFWVQIRISTMSIMLIPVISRSRYCEQQNLLNSGVQAARQCHPPLRAPEPGCTGGLDPRVLSSNPPIRHL